MNPSTTRPPRTVRAIAHHGDDWTNVGADDEFTLRSAGHGPKTVEMTLGTFRFPGVDLDGNLSVHVATEYAVSGTHTVELVQGDRIVLVVTDDDMSEHDIAVAVPADVIAALSYDGHGIARPALAIRYTADLRGTESGR